MKTIASALWLLSAGADAASPVSGIRDATGDHGSVRMSITVGIEGRITKCHVEWPSGVKALDDTSCDYISRRGQFLPARNRNGNPISRSISFTIHYLSPGMRQSDADLPMNFTDNEAAVVHAPTSSIFSPPDLMGQGRSRPPQRIKVSGYPKFSPDILAQGYQGRTVAIVGVNESGRPFSCDVARTSGTPELDIEACRWIQKSVKYQPGTDFNGNPVSSYVVEPVNWFPDCLGIDCREGIDP